MGGDPLLSGRSGVGGAPKSGRRAPWAGLRRDAVAGAVLGVESVPDGLATGLLAGVNPLAGVYGYMVGTVTGALATSSAYMAVQGTGAMAIIVADVPAVHHGHDPPRALFTLAMLTGVAMVVAGALRLGGVLRFVSNAVMVGFINAVGVNIVLGQLESLTGYSSDQSSRVTRALDTVLHPGRLDGRSVVVGMVTIGLILLLERTPLGPLGMVVAVFVTSAGAGALGWSVAQVKDLGATLAPFPAPKPRIFGSYRRCWCRRCRWRWSGWSRVRASRPTSRMKMGPIPTHPGTLSDRAWPTSRRARCRACRWEGRCPPRR